MATSVNPTAGLGNTNAYFVAATSPKVMVNGDAVFTAVGDCELVGIWSECISANDATASTLQWQHNPTTGSAATISGATATLASAAAGTIVVLDGSSLTAAPVITASGVALHTTARGIVLKDGILKSVIGVGSTTGTWRHYIQYIPYETGAYVYPNF